MGDAQNDESLAEQLYSQHASTWNFKSTRRRQIRERNNQKQRRRRCAPQQEPSYTDGAPRSKAAIKPSKMSSYMNFEGNLTVESDKCAYTEDAIISDYT